MSPDVSASVRARLLYRARLSGDNIPNLVVDAFCSGQIRLDESDHKDLGLYEDDTVAHAGMVHVARERVEADESAEIEIFGRRL